MQHSDAEVLLAVDGGSIVGLASVYLEPPFIRFGKRCWLQDLVVVSSRRSQGIGALLLDAATDWARQRGCTHLELASGEGRKEAHRFYRAQEMTGGMVFTRQV